MKRKSLKSGAVLCLLGALFCAYGFVAAGEPGPNHEIFRIGYAVAGVLCLVGFAILGATK